MRKHFIIGCGFRQNASIESFESALSKTPETEYYSGICVPEDKMSHEALCAFAQKLNLPIYGVKSDVISGTGTPTKSFISTLRRSIVVFNENQSGKSGVREFGPIPKMVTKRTIIARAVLHAMDCSPHHVHIHITPSDKVFFIQSKTEQDR